MHPLLPHFQQQIRDREWLAPLLINENPSSFPYQLVNNGTAELDWSTTSSPPFKCNPQLHNLAPKTPIYLINIPHVPPRNERIPYRKFRKILEKIRDTSAGCYPAYSQKTSKNRVCTVICINQPQSLDPIRNEKFVDYVKSLPHIAGVNYRAFGRLWVPNWRRRLGFHHNIATAKKAFFILKQINPTTAKSVIARYEGVQRLSPELESQIPYQRIRKMNVTHIFTIQFFTKIREKRPNNPLFLVTLDDDFSSVSRLFVEYDKLISARLITDRQVPQVLSTGYHAAQDAAPIYKIGIKTDMAVREAMANFVPHGIYYPEPNTIYLIENDPRELNFIGGGNKLESRRAIHSGINRGTIAPNRMVFKSIPCLITSIPRRMKRPYNEQTITIEQARLDKHKTRRALATLSQSHFNHKQWADNLYLALPVRGVVTDYTKHLMTLFLTFSPSALSKYEVIGPTRAFVTQPQLQIPSILDIYEEYSGQMLTVLTQRNIAHVNESDDCTPVQNLVIALRSDAFSALDELKALGLNREWRNKVIACAHASGVAAARILREEDI